MLAKEERTYKRLVEVLGVARRSGRVRWEMLRDDAEISQVPVAYDGPDDFRATLVQAARDFRLDRQAGQAVRLETWSETAGMVNQLVKVADPYGVPVYSGSGFNGLSAKRAARVTPNRYRSPRGPTAAARSACGHHRCTRSGGGTPLTAVDNEGEAFYEALRTGRLLVSVRNVRPGLAERSAGRVTDRRPLGTGPQAAHTVRATQADLIDALPGIHLPDVADLRARGVLGTPPATPPAPRRALGSGHSGEEAAPGA